MYVCTIIFYILLLLFDCCENDIGLCNGGVGFPMLFNIILLSISSIYKYILFIINIKLRKC